MARAHSYASRAVHYGKRMGRKGRGDEKEWGRKGKGKRKGEKRERLEGGREGSGEVIQSKERMVEIDEALI